MEKYLIDRVKQVSYTDLDQIIDLIKSQNKDSILSSLSIKLIKEFINISINYDDIYVFTCWLNDKILGYSIFVKKPDLLIKRYEKLRLGIFMHVLFNLRFSLIVNLFLSLTNLDLIKINKEKRNIIKNSVNLNLLAIDGSYQSKGIGSNFLMETTKILKKFCPEMEHIVCEAPNERALKFYKDNKFEVIGKKLRFFKKYYILSKKII